MSQQQKKINSRIQLKNDTSANWHTASENGFTPLKGEFICYTDLEPYRLKLGDGEHTPDELPWYDKTLEELGGVKAVKNTTGTNAVPVMNNDKSSIAAYKGYSSEATPDTLVYRTSSNGAFNVVEATGSKHPVPKAQMEKYVADNTVKKNTDAQTVYITDPEGNQSSKKYTSEAYPSTIAHREASLDTIMLADPLYNGHPVTKQYAEERYFPIQSKPIEIINNRAWELEHSFYLQTQGNGWMVGPRLIPGEEYKLGEYIFIAIEKKDENSGQAYGTLPYNIEWGYTEASGVIMFHTSSYDSTYDRPWEIGFVDYESGREENFSERIDLFHREGHRGIKPFKIFSTYSMDFRDLDEWIANNLKHGQKVFTIGDNGLQLDTTTVATIVPDPDAENISQSRNIINPYCSHYDQDGNPKVFNFSAFLYVNQSQGGYIVRFPDGQYYWHDSIDVNYEFTEADKAENYIQQGATITFYDVADYGEHVTSAVLIQDPLGNPSYKNYTSGPNTTGDDVAGNIVAFNSEGYFNVPEPTSSLHPVNKKWVEAQDYVDKEKLSKSVASSSGPNSQAEADNNDFSACAGKLVRFTDANGRFNVMDPTSSLHPVNKRTMEKYIKENAPVTSVAGKTGVVKLYKGDVGLGNVDNTADANKSVKHATNADKLGGTLAEYYAKKSDIPYIPQSDWEQEDVDAKDHIKNRTHYDSLQSFGIGFTASNMFTVDCADAEGIISDNGLFLPGYYVFKKRDSIDPPYTCTITSEQSSLFDSVSTDGIKIYANEASSLERQVRDLKQLDSKFIPIDNDTLITNDEGQLVVNETDPTVPAWAKAATKPTYTASEVHALPDTTTIPEALADLTSDSTHRTVTDAEKTAWNAKSNFSGSYNDLTNKPTIPAAANNGTLTIQKNGTTVASFDANQSTNATANIIVPTKVSELSNDSNFANTTYVDNKVAGIIDTAPEALNTLNELAAALGDDPNFATTVMTEIGKKADKTAIPDALADLAADATHRTVTDAEKATWNAKSNFDGNYNNLTNKPTIPTVNNATLTIQKNGSSVATFTANSATNATANIEVPTKTSQLTNDSNFVTSSGTVAKATTADQLGGVAASSYAKKTDIPSIPVTSVAGKTGTVTLNKGDVGLGNVDNTADANKSVNHATTADNVTWSSTPTAGSITPIGASLSSEHSANRLAYLNPEALSFEYSDDGGASWAPMNVTDSAKLSLVTTNGGFHIGYTTPVTTNHRTRVTLTAQDGTTGYFYTQTRKLLLNVGTNGHGMSVTIEIKTGESGANWRTLGAYSLAGWTGWNDIPLGAFAFGGSTSQTTNIWYMRLTFATTSVHEPYKNSRSTVLGMRLFGDTCWTRTSNMGETGHLYSYDIYQNAAFPGSVQATDVFDTNGNHLSDKVDYNVGQNLTSSQKAQARANIGAGTSNFSGNYNDLTYKPTIPPAANNGTLTIQRNGVTVATFGANQSTNATANITVPTKTSDITNDSGFITSYTETDPTVPNHVKSIKQGDITNWNNKVDRVVNDQIKSNGIPVMLDNSSSIAAYKGYGAEAIPETLVYRTAGTGAFNVVDATSSRHPVPKAQMESYAVKKNTDKQTVYITDPNGNQSSKKYTSEGYPSTIVHREAALNTFIVADPVYNGHPVTMRFGNERYFPIQKSSTKRVYKKFTISNANNFSTELNNWLNTNTEMGQKLFTDPSVSFSGTTIVTIIADPTDSITSAKKIINPACHSGENAYSCSAGLLIKAANNSNLGYVFKGVDGVWKFSENNTPESFSSMVTANSSVISNGSYIDFYDVADYTEHVTSAVMIQDPLGNPSYKKYSSGPNKLGDNVAGNIVAFNSSGYFNVPDPVSSLHPVNKAWVEKNAATKTYVDSEITKLLKILEGQLLTKIVCTNINVFTNACVLKNNGKTIKWTYNTSIGKYETYVPRGSVISAIWVTVGSLTLAFNNGETWECSNESSETSVLVPLQASQATLTRVL